MSLEGFIPCPLCGKADAVMSKQTSVPAADSDISVTVVMPTRYCGRCLRRLVLAAIHAVQEEHKRMRRMRA